MKKLWPLIPFLLLPAAFAQPQAVIEVPDAELEAAHQTNPDNLHITGRLLNYYSRDNRDAAWSARFSILSWNVEHHPDAPFFGAREAYGVMPQPMREQLKQLWIAQVQRHPDNPRILRNAATALDDQPASIRVGGNVQKVNLISQVQPEYPALARQARIQGTVRFTATIGPEGEVTNLQLDSGHPLLVTPAMTAVNQWRYKPTLLNGRPVSVITTIDVTFALDGAGQLNPQNGVQIH